MIEYPKLDDVVKAGDVSTKGTGKFAADYVNWSRIAHYLREHAPGWQPFAERSMEHGHIWHVAPDGSFYLLIGFRCGHEQTQTVPHAIMDHKMQAKQQPDARDVADAFVRGMCKAAALLFGLGWQLWSKDDPLGREETPTRTEPAKAQGFDSPEQAGAVLGRCTTDDHDARWWAKVKASGFAKEEVDALIEAAKEHKAKRLEAATNG